MRTLMFIVTVSITSSASAMSWDFAPKKPAVTIRDCDCGTGQPCTCAKGCECKTEANALPSAAAAVGVISTSPTVAFLSLPQEAPQGTDALLAYADDCADGSCSIVRGQPVRNVVRAVADRPRRLFARRPVRSFLGRFRLFGGCRGCN